VSTVLALDLIEDLVDRASLGEMVQLDLQRLVAALGLVLQRSVNVLRDVADESETEAR
jgi:hypothetical protein